jgi:hypothetical protein
MERLFVLRSEQHAKALEVFVRCNWKQMENEGRPMAVLVTEHKSKRNTQQNRLYWALLREISEQAWVEGKQFSSEAWHAFFAGKFIGWQDAPGGIKTPISTTTLDVHAFAEYVTQIQAYAGTELGIELI